MTITIEIHYKAASRIMQRASFSVKGRKPEYIALQFWKQIQKDMSYRAILEQVFVNGDNDITQLVKDLEKQEFLKSMEDGLPF
jgi:hypothetical protein